MLVTVVILALLVYDRVERRIQQDAELLLDLQVQEVVAALGRYGAESDRFEEWLDQKTEVGDRTVDLGVALFDERGRPCARRVLAQVRAPHPCARARRPRGGPRGAIPLRGERPDAGRHAPGRDLPGPSRGAGHIGRVFQIAIPAVLI
jgi:hypothetical protein